MKRIILGAVLAATMGAATAETNLIVDTGSATHVVATFHQFDLVFTAKENCKGATRELNKKAPKNITFTCEEG